MTLKSALLLMTFCSGLSSASFAQSDASPGFFRRLADAVVYRNNPRVFLENPPPNFHIADRSLRKVPDQSQVTPFTEKSLVTKELKNGVLYDSTYGQDLYLNDSLDEKLLRHSIAEGWVETAHTIAYDLNGKMLAISPMIMGNRDSIESDLLHIAFKSVYPSGRHGLIEIVHVHPYFDFQFYKDEAQKGAIVHPLSESDLYHVQRQSMEAPGTYVRMRAVLPSGYSYSATFLNGRRVVDPTYDVSAQGRATKLFYFVKKVLQDAGIQTRDKDYFEFEKMAETQFRSGKTYGQVLALIRETQIAMKKFEVDDLSDKMEATPNSCSKVFFGAL